MSASPASAILRPVLSPYSSLLGLGIAPAMQRVGLLNELPALLQGFGVRPATVFRRVNLASDALADPEGRIPYAAIGPLLDECVAATGCKHFGLVAGSRWRLEHLGPLGEIAGSCATVERALETFASFHWVNASGGVAFFLRNDGASNFGYAIFEAGIRRGMQQIYDLALAVAVNLVRDLCGNPRWAPSAVMMSRTRPDDPRPYRRFFGAPIRFDADASMIRFPSAFCATPVPGADEARRQSLEAKFRALGREGTGLRLHRILRVGMMFGLTSGDGLAAALALSRRTFNRRLAERGTTFQRELASARFEVAQQLLRNTTLQVGEIASALGYAELGPFIRAFRRWTGRSPAEWRRTAARPSGGRQLKLARNVTSKA